ncbi:hypothetical protein RFI_28166 [Reticulomyxa filosa]|uniref:Mediator of RNA polymerase II transcription subunit 31 n=1 Tax=Reticulomyxa filosa TaxID=46433 RepID=X6M5G1_RETFI|nr:hypothetical protein RFI_28166 [Reticulomyxa filosa]|eukprot:ETO09223.1 hypothetical protein RFI_28166 [Reticulomyxa filosa]
MLTLLAKMKELHATEDGECLESVKRKHLRFSMEKEFVEMLANPHYLQCLIFFLFFFPPSFLLCEFIRKDLAQNNYFENKKFIKYLEYLQYWKKPEYACLVKLNFVLALFVCETQTKAVFHVHALRFLELLQMESFRKALKEPVFVEMLHQNQFWHWRFYKSNRFNENEHILPFQKKLKLLHHFCRFYCFCNEYNHFTFLKLHLLLKLKLKKKSCYDSNLKIQFQILLNKTKQNKNEKI